MKSSCPQRAYTTLLLSSATCPTYNLSWVISPEFRQLCLVSVSWPWLHQHFGVSNVAYASPSQLMPWPLRSSFQGTHPWDILIGLVRLLDHWTKTLWCPYAHIHHFCTSAVTWLLLLSSAACFFGTTEASAFMYLPGRLALEKYFSMWWVSDRKPLHWCSF